MQYEVEIPYSVSFDSASRESDGRWQGDGYYFNSYEVNSRSNDTKISANRFSFALENADVHEGRG